MLCHTCSAALGCPWSKQTGFEKPEPLTCSSEVTVFVFLALFLAFLQIHRAGCIKRLLCFLGNLKTYRARNSKDWGRGKDMHLCVVNFSTLSLKITWVCSFGTQGLCKSAAMCGFWRKPAASGIWGWDYRRKNFYFVIIVARDAQEYWFLNSSHFIVLRIQLIVWMTRMYHMWLYAKVKLICTRETFQVHFKYPDYLTEKRWETRVVWMFMFLLPSLLDCACIIISF